jgi:flagellar basal-body rod modification protein FlgD
LLVAQLQNQNPLDPTDTGEFMSQMLSYASYDMQSQMNQQLSNLTSAINAMSSGSVIGYLNQNVEAYGDTTTLQDGKASWGYTLNAEASDVSIAIKDENGTTVWTGAGETAAGEHTFEWDGVTSGGTKLTDGKYTIEVAATDANGDSVYGTTSISGTVTSIDSSSGTTLLTVGGVEVTLDSIFSVTA